MKGKRKLLCELIIFALLLMTVSIVAAEGKTERQMAEELIYGKWAVANTGAVKYQFDENNVQIVHIGHVDPYGSSRIRVKLRDAQGGWNIWRSVFVIQLEHNHYTLHIRQAGPNNSVTVTGPFVKVY